MKICIYGAGSLGTILGAYLAKAGLEVDLVSRNRSHVEGLRARGAQVVGTVTMTVPVSALFPEEVRGPYGLVFLMTKQQDNPRVVRDLLPLLGEAGLVCTLQNGIPEPGIAEILGPERTFGCAVAWGATLLGGGVSELTSAPDELSFSLGTLGRSNGADLGRIKGILEAMGPVEVEGNFLGARWSKLLVNASFSGMSAVLGATFGEVARNRASRVYIHRLMKECMDVARLAQVSLEPIQGKDVVRLFDYRGRLKQSLAFAILPLAIKKHRLLKASMLQDLEKGKKTEVEAINGLVAEYGDRYNFPTPCNDLVVDMVHRIEAGELRPGWENLAAFAGL